jgi:hypothetical protein
MKIVESMKIGVPGGMRSRVKETILFAQESIDSSSVQLQNSPALGDDARSCESTARFRQVALERLADDLAQLFALTNGFELCSPEQVFVEKGADFSSSHVKMLS